MARRHPGATEKRGDISPYLIHLTRDDSGDEHGAEAVENFKNILATKRIAALRPHCLHLHRIPQNKKHLFRVTCFTETPIDQIQNLISVRGRQKKLEAYGFVFKKDFLIDRGAQQTIYINSYNGNDDLRLAFDSLFEGAKSMGFTGKRWKILPYLNTMQDNCDFAWEREWRIRGDLDFTPDDLVCAILPEYEDDELFEKLDAMGIAYIDPNWNVSRMVGALAGQKRQTRKIWKPKPAPKPVVKKSITLPRKKATAK